MTQNEPTPQENLPQEIERLVRSHERSTGRVAKRLYINHDSLARLINELPEAAFKEDAFGCIFYRGLRVVPVLPEAHLQVG